MTEDLKHSEGLKLGTEGIRNRALLEFPTLLAEVARLGTQLQIANAEIVRLSASREEIREQLESEVARLKAELATVTRLASDDRRHWSDEATAREATAREEERERAAKIADDLGDSDKNDTVLHNDTVSFCSGYETGCREVAAAIRSTP